MNVKGFILEDDQGREFVMGCEGPTARLGRTFLIRGWQRRRLIPLPYSEQEARHIVGEALMALDDLFSSLLKRCHDQTMTVRLQGMSCRLCHDFITRNYNSSSVLTNPTPFLKRTDPHGD